MTTDTAAFVTSTAEFEQIDNADAGTRAGKIRLRIRAERTDGGSVFVGIARDEVIEDFIQGGSFATIRDLEFGPFDYRSVSLGGRRDLPIPDPDVFTVSAAGEGEQTVEWPIQAGSWRAIIMNADGSAGVDVEANFGIRFPYLRGFAIAGMVIGGLFLLFGILLLVINLRPRRKPPEPEPEPEPTA